MKKESLQKRLENEKKFGEFLIENGAEEIWHWETPTGKVRSRQRFEKIIQATQIKAKTKVLEYGCGTGIYSRMLATTGACVTSIDISSHLLEKATSLSKEYVNISFIETDAMNTGFEESYYDAVVGVSVLHHLDYDAAFFEIMRLLKSGGVMAFSEPNYLNPHIWLERSSPKMRKKFNVSPDESAFVRFSLKKLLKKHGFTDITITPFDFLHPITPVKFIPTVKLVSDFVEKIPLVREIAGSLFISAKKI